MEASAWGRRSRRWRWPPTRRRPSSPGGSKRGPCCPLDTTAPGPPSGAMLGPGPFNGFSVPFATQPVQGFSGILRAGPGVWWALPDNGYGRKENSADWLLRIYRVRTDLEPAGGGTGRRGGRGIRAAQRSRRQVPVPARPRRPDADRRRRRPGVDPRGTRRDVLDRRRVRPVDAALRSVGPPARSRRSRSTACARRRTRPWRSGRARRWTAARGSRRRPRRRAASGRSSSSRAR